MNLQISCDDFDLSPQIKALIYEKFTQKLDKLLTHLPPDLLSAQMRLNQDKFEHYSISFDLSLPHKKIIAKSEHTLLESAIIDLEQEVHKQITHYKESHLS